jgi:mRNA-degrading endonuclease RelE of RelBE toxin-antitoxin system
MKRYRARLTTECAAAIRRLHPQIKREIREAVGLLVASPLSGHALHFELAGLRSFRARYHRVIYRIDEENETLDIVFVGQRRDVYEQLRDMVLDQQRG